MTQPIKSDAVTLLALGSQMGLQGFEGTPAKAASEPDTQPTATPKPTAAANSDHADASTVMALAKSARLQCVSDDAGAQ
ncbi:hypothetical protein U1737_17115 [Sphingomonas sp. LB3N6]|uniref:hypothetical protein n=1 Tax=Sphingomonas fucosidasi TaxID=3096164 RepID=UPI002FCC4E47